VRSYYLIGAATLGFVIAISGGSAQAQAPSPTPAATRPTTTRAAAPRGFFAEPRRLTRGLTFVERRLDTEESGQVKQGFYPDLGNMVTGSGWISAGVGYRQSYFDDRALVEASTGISWRGYKMAQARVEWPVNRRVIVGTQFRWQDLTQVTYFGAGPQSQASDRSEYRMKSLNHVGYVAVQARESLSVEARLGWLSGPELRRPAGAFLSGNPATDEMFPHEPAFALAEQPDYLYGEAALTVDTRDAPGYPTQGGIYRAGWTRYADRAAGRFSFQRFEGEATHFVPFVDGNIVVALHGWVVGTSTAKGEEVPFYLMPSLGGSNTLRAFSDYRFHDRHFAVVNAETRVAIFEHLDAVAFVDAGNVATRWSDLNLKRTSYGVGVQLHNRESTYARFDVAKGAEGWRVVFQMNNPFDYSRLRKRSAPAPFAP
jgi:hypothetical protein